MWPPYETRTSHARKCFNICCFQRHVLGVEDVLALFVEIIQSAHSKPLAATHYATQVVPTSRRLHYGQVSVTNMTRVKVLAHLFALGTACRCACWVWLRSSSKRLAFIATNHVTWIWHSDRDQGVAVNALWPRTMIATAAVVSLGRAIQRSGDTNGHLG